MDNIKESKEYKLAKEWEMAVNSFSFNPKPSVLQPLYLICTPHCNRASIDCLRSASL